MQQNQPFPLPPPSYLPIGTEMAAVDVSGLVNISPGDFNSNFDWSDLLDFNVDETFAIPFPEAETGADSGVETGVIHSSPPQNVTRIRKRDPRLLCPNFLAGRVPCVCPDMDEKTAAEEEAALPGKKRARSVRVVGGPIRCQVSGCEADITELKGYHKRHRVCLHCANVSSVEIDGEQKRYCQQCGKFHPLPDFDEGKRSCRRKLERHNNRRRRKPDDSKQSRGKEPLQINLEDDASGDDDESGKDVSSRVKEVGPSLAPEGNEACPSLGSEKQQPGEINADTQRQISVQRSSPSSGENRNTFSSACPTGRISFKLYDWNPAEFPRQLRLQIFQWLASMPVELEGYIRPGCTILTAFVAMPRPMWRKVLDDPIVHIKDFISSPGNELSRRGSMLIYMNDMPFRVTKDRRNSLVKVKVNDCCPRLHYVHPTCFVPGRPIEFIACGSNLLQSNLRFLVSFSGRYLAYNISVPSRCRTAKFNPSFDHQLVKIVAPLTDENLVGPAFIEVENKSGLSNFIPILVGDKETCNEIQHFIQESGTFRFSVKKPYLSCDTMKSRQALLSELLLDVAWLVKPERDKPLTPSDVLRFNSLLKFLIDKESSAVLERVLGSLSSALSRHSGDGVSFSEMRALQKNIRNAEYMLLLSRGKFYFPCSKTADRLATPEILKNMNFTSESQDWCSSVPLLAGDVEMNVNLVNYRPQRYLRLALRPSFLTSRYLIAIAAVVFCVGACMFVFHPHSVNLIAVKMRRCMFDMP